MIERKNKEVCQLPETKEARIKKEFEKEYRQLQKRINWQNGLMAIFPIIALLMGILMSEL